MPYEIRNYQNHVIIKIIVFMTDDTTKHYNEPVYVAPVTLKNYIRKFTNYCKD